MRASRAALAVATAAAMVAGLTVVAVRRDAAPPAAAPSPTAEPSASPSPTYPAVPSPATPEPGAAPTVRGVLEALRAPLRDPALGARVSAVVLDAETGEPLYESVPEVPVVPASTAKIATAMAVLKVLGPDRRLETRLLARGTVADGVLTGDLVLVGGGDPTLATPAARPAYPPPARLDTLAASAKPIRRVTGGIVVDASVFTGPRTGPGWKPGYVTEGSVAPVAGLMVDGGKLDPAKPASRAPDPDLAAGRALRDLLRKQGTAVGNAVVRGRAAAADTELGVVRSPPMSALVERLLAASDNNLAEALAHLVAAEGGLPATFDGGAAALESELGQPASGLVDGSGLSPRNRVTTGGLALLLRTAAADPAYRPVLTGLPVAGFDGTLVKRYADPASAYGAGRVRAKTGTLDNVSTLAGVIETAGGRLLLFAFSADRLPTRNVGKAAKALDAAAAALARCGCR